MNKYKKELILTIIVGAVLFLLGIVFIVYGIVNKSKIVYFGIIWCALYGGLYIYKIVAAVKRQKSANAKVGFNLNLIHSQLLKVYNSVKDFGEVGYVSFVDDGLKFSAEGKYACVKDFNDMRGYHFAFNIVGTKLVAKPDDYDDILHYEDTLFNIELAYFDGAKLSEQENNNGIVLEGIEHLQGTTVKIKQNDGYCAQIATVEWDEIDCGEITFEQWDDNAHIISFKLLATSGICDVIAGRVNLLEDKD